MIQVVILVIACNQAAIVSLSLCIDLTCTQQYHGFQNYLAWKDDPHYVQVGPAEALISLVNGESEKRQPDGLPAEAAAQLRLEL
jgi:hypothetical protein